MFLLSSLTALLLTFNLAVGATISIRNAGDDPLNTDTDKQPEIPHKAPDTEILASYLRSWTKDQLSTFYDVVYVKEEFPTLPLELRDSVIWFQRAAARAQRKLSGENSSPKPLAIAKKTAKSLA
ncbi:MAG: hypothetical protein M1829_000849 [Trizodia sp. TS-e1964]|nr:MAG: hypothetical protein M1829_000849 [Trizodia sp. TS-e1964]